MLTDPFVYVEGFRFNGVSLVARAPEPGIPTHVFLEHIATGQITRAWGMVDRPAEEGPAMRDPDGTVWYVERGHLHWLAGPAVIHRDGSAEYWRHGVLTRNDGPAILSPDGRQLHFQGGRYVRRRVRRATGVAGEAETPALVA